jgi:DNA-binding protein YbaB
MKDLIEALQILMKYGNPDYPTHCEHDVLTINIDPSLVSEEDTKRLDKLGVFACEDEEHFQSFKFGSC